MGSVAMVIWPGELLGCGCVDLALCVWLPVCDYGVSAFCLYLSLLGPVPTTLCLCILGIARYREASI